MFGLFYDYAHDCAEYASDSARYLSKRVTAYMQPLPPVPTSANTVWKYYEYPRFIPKEKVEEEQQRQKDLFDFFKVAASRALLDDHTKQNYLFKYVLCALHKANDFPAFNEQLPGLGLDLMVIYGMRSQYDSHVVAHYANTIKGNARDRLFATALQIIELDPNNEHTLRTALNNPLSLLRLSLEGHRLPMSYKAMAGHNPDTISELNELLRQRQHRRITQP